MEIVIKVDDVKDWVYKGEGAANIILGYRGSSPLLVNPGN
jgi:inositol-pentakisphosphate 2-kinase